MSVALEAPALLIAVPSLADPNFQRAVIFLASHNDDGSMGLVLSSPTTVPFTDLFASADLAFGGAPGRVEVGGPVEQDRAFLLHAGPRAGPESQTVAEGTFLSNSLESLRAIAAEPPADLRIFLGYAGWGPGQLAQEFQDGSWLLAPLTAERLFVTPPEQIWAAALADIGVDPARLVHDGGVH